MQASQTSSALQKWVQQSAFSRSLFLVLIGSALLAASAWIEVPLAPVPVTMQTCALMLIGAFYGSRLAFATAWAYLFEGALGLPVFAGGAGGAQHLLGPTAGYLAAYPFVAAFVGWVAERSWSNHFYALFGAMVLGNVVIFAGGAAWLATFIGMERAIQVGVMPFILGDLVKSALAAAIVLLASKRR